MGSQNVFSIDGRVIGAAAGFVEVISVLPTVEEQEIFVLIRNFGYFTYKFWVGFYWIGRNSSDYVVPNVFYQDRGEEGRNAAHDQTIKIILTDYLSYGDIVKYQSSVP